MYFNAFLHFYTAISYGRGNDLRINIQEPFLKTHGDIFDVVLFLRRNATLSQNSFQDQAFDDANEPEKEYASRMTVKIALMIDCASKDDFSDSDQLHGSFPVKRTAAQNFVEFLEGAFPMTGTCPFHTESSNRSMKAWKMKKRNGNRFITTNDVVQNLLYDPQASTVKIFHQEAFVKTHLWHTGKTSAGYYVRRLGANKLKSCPYSGSLTPQLLLETLFTLYYILFPVSVNQQLAKLAKSLVKKRKFDPNLMVDDGSIRTIPPDFMYVYWGERSRILEAITTNPPPSNKTVSWVARHTSERNALTVVIIGIFLTILFGFLGLIVGIAQLAVSILAWKHPVASAA